MLHEALDVAQPGALRIAEPLRDAALDVERQALLGVAGDEMHVAAHRPQEILAAPEQPVFGAVEHALLDQFLGIAHPVDVFGDPEQGVEVAQAALAVLDVGLDQIARLAAAAMALLALGELGGDELGGGALHHLLVEARHHLVEQGAVAEQEPRLQDRGADGHVGLGEADAVVDRARRVADLEPHVPQAIEDGLGDLLAPGGLLVGQQEQQIDVRARRHQAAAVAAGRDDRHALGFRRALRRIEVRRREGVDHPDDLVLHLAQPRGAAAAMAVLEQQPLGFGAAFGKHRLEALGDRGAQLALVAEVASFVQLVDDGVGDRTGRPARAGQLEGLGHASSDSRGGAPCHGRASSPSRNACVLA